MVIKHLQHSLLHLQHVSFLKLICGAYFCFIIFIINSLKNEIMKTKAFFFVIMLALLSLNGEAQEDFQRFGFELNLGPSFATHEIPMGKLENGLGIEGIFSYNFMTHTGMYAGWGWNTFSSKVSFAGESMGVEETGYVFGLQFKHPIDGFRTAYYLRAGGLYKHIEIENKRGDITADSGHGLGWQLAAGLDIPLASTWSLLTSLKYNSLPDIVEIEGRRTHLLMNYLSLRVGLLKKF
jgi:hypothetical protein